MVSLIADLESGLMHGTDHGVEFVLQERGAARPPAESFDHPNMYRVGYYFGTATSGALTTYFVALPTLFIPIIRNRQHKHEPPHEPGNIK